MENQNKNNLTTKSTPKDVENFLKEKDKAMEEIIMDEDVIIKDIDEIIKNSIKNNINNDNNLKRS